MTATTLQPAQPAAPEPAPGPRSHQAGTGRRLVTLAIVAGPVIALGCAVPLLWGHEVNLSDLVMAAVLYLFTGFGITIGYHRLFSHGSFVPKRPLKVALAVLGSMAVEGSVTGWVATHRRHHRFSDAEGDPHSPYRYGPGARPGLRGLAFAHVGWLFGADDTSSRRYAPDLHRDRDLQRVSALFPVLALASLAIPFGLGYALAGTLTGAITALVWAGGVRMAMLHHVTWGVNSLCHSFGTRSHETRDRSTNIAALSLISLGDSWHNVHHAHPAWARHGALPGQLDPSALVIRAFERLGWATRVRWPALQAATEA